jgi:hypothetical protein
MIMEKQLSRTLDLIQINFWRMAATVIGSAVTHKKALEQMMKYFPYAVAGIGAFLLGRLFGGMLL